MKIRHPKEVTIKTFSSREESSTGADWELWIRSKKNYWVGFRIQAKVINLSTNKYECLHYRSKSKKDSSLQSRKLIDSAFRPQHKLFPIYCLYSFWEYSNYPKFYNYTRSKGSAEHFGCSFVDAFTVLELESCDTKNIKDIFPFMSPWSDLVCCSSKDDLAIHAHKECKSWCTNSLNNPIFYGVDDDYLNSLNSIEVYQNAPKYIEDILKTGSTNIDDDDPNLRYITIFLETMTPQF